VTEGIRYTDSLEGIEPYMLEGFFEGWKNPLSPKRHLDILRGSTHVVLAVDDHARKAVGFITAITDKTNCAFIPLLEVLPAYRNRGIGSELVTRMLKTLEDYPCIDLSCDAELQPFYAKLGLSPSVGMIIRDYRRRGPGP